jgi:hypothetical protein
MECIRRRKAEAGSSFAEPNLPPVPPPSSPGSPADPADPTPLKEEVNPHNNTQLLYNIKGPRLKRGEKKGGRKKAPVEASLPAVPTPTESAIPAASIMASGLSDQPPLRPSAVEEIPPAETETRGDAPPVAVETDARAAMARAIEAEAVRVRGEWLEQIAKEAREKNLRAHSGAVADE